MTRPSSPASTKWRTPMTVLVAGGGVVLMTMGLRASLGLYLKPMSLDLGWGREVFALALAMQNICWGAVQPFTCAIAEKWGTGRVVAVGGILYASGLYIMSSAADPLTLQLSAGLLLGLGQSGAGLAIVLGAVGRAVSAEKRSWALGVVSAAAAAGQLLIVPLGQVFLGAYGWSTGFLLLGVMALVIVALAGGLRDGGTSAADHETEAGPRGLGAAIAEAGGHAGYWLLNAGFFVCGFQVAFIGVHLPAYLTDQGMAPGTGAWSLALIGFFNMIGCYAAGVLGTRRRKKHLLSWLYLLRSLVIGLFILLPISTVSVLLFSSALGVLWLSTVPLTSGLVAQIFGPRYMATLFAIIFFGHQVGSFLGVWLGGRVFDATGSYDPVWWMAIVFGVMSALLHWPINDRVVVRAAEA